VALALGKIGDKRAIPVLAQAAKVGDDDLRIAAVWALAQFHERKCSPSSFRKRNGRNPIIQSFLANTLAGFQDHRVVSILCKLAVHPNREVAFQAVCALGESGAKEGIPVLKGTWRSGNDLVRAASAVSLRRLGTRPAQFSMKAMAAGIGALAALSAGAGYFFYK